MELTSRLLKIVAVDPGNNLGMACLEVDLSTGMITALVRNLLFNNIFYERYYRM